MQTVRRIAILVTAASAIASAGASGQDAHYWSQQYGTKSTLLGGAVIGSVDDLSATYYNPAALALVDDPSVLLSAQAFQYRKLTALFREMGQTEQYPFLLFCRFSCLSEGHHQSLTCSWI